ncbi:hypothetical protein H5410_058287 [Solanum commersonii]|uniref:Uncharacterized protein n=1 Tax=Solanum commersonii TaxID=4109 RepID=A0A9J5WQN2_SOLCO|nr:hypothetical protein H5410_058287 [Solanum commersonii]
MESSGFQEKHGSFLLWSRRQLNEIAKIELILSMTKDITRACLIKKVLLESNAHIFIQKENVRPDINVNNIEFNEAVHKGGIDIQLCFFNLPII